MRSEQIPATVDELMTEDLIAVRPIDRVGRARDLLIALGIHALPVMNGNEVVGIVTTADLVDDWPEETPVSEIMSRTPFVIASAASLVEAAEEMLAHEVHHLLVTDGSETVGILSSLDLLRAVVPLAAAVDV